MTVWFASRPGIGIETLVRFVELAIEICVAAGFHRRASNLALELCDVVGTARVALDVLPKTLPSLRLCEAEDKEVGPARADAAESALRRARAEVPEHVATLRARAPASSRPTIPPAPERKRPPSREPSPPARSRRCLCTAPRRARRPRRATDRPRPRRSSSSGTLCARRGSWRRLRAPGARVLTASSGGTTWRSTRPAAGAGAFSLRRPRRRSGCSACAGVCAPRTPPPDSPRARVRKPSGPPTSEGDGADNADDDDADVKHRTSAPLGVGARVEIARVASRFLEAASRASLGDARFFGGGFCGFNEPDAPSAASASPGPETDVSWETIGDGVVDGWDAFLFDARATCDDAPR